MNDASFLILVVFSPALGNLITLFFIVRNIIRIRKTRAETKAVQPVGAHKKEKHAPALSEAEKAETLLPKNLHRKWVEQCNKEFAGGVHSAPVIITGSLAVLADLRDINEHRETMAVYDKHDIQVLANQTDKLLTAYMEAHQMGTTGSPSVQASFTRQLGELQTATNAMKDNAVEAIISQFSAATGFIREKYNGGEPEPQPKLALTAGLTPAFTITTAAAPLTEQAPVKVGVMRKLLNRS